ncbi:MAG: hypothetical protein COW18_00060 [Zetaproteobacteria bacterium CG12_big_fil_rev_8_21_14_0_65_54_13]|nr:MAG: hypothetical protein COX55_07090 [Zetaproteobacteria bacterium CG23_combo_of_CG06-09_8_20_14_all_54_7]PIW51599.1 MAG: hypothetical protein COW18_00060 [Zetaproteobacteria bacterium CG12_big_fil_rev_8_21_14_0_65_54_13]PIX55442.1 MAG: hypothetical protein COZ50_02760 [Zetaproteobacteria bacterium CG_4_10_14_3_um_filter_54_28]PJA28415.1 MAG: hypothetical protein CO188_09515 [Zetaproteobacteria bacterium CG_4_9_14_3_um_filter_54_145]
MFKLNPVHWFKRRRAAEKPSDTFCPAPFRMINVMPPGTAKPCCAYSGQINRAGKAMSVYQHSVEEIWNSDQMRTLRRELDNGGKPAECGYCFRREALGFESMRQFGLKASARQGLDVDALRSAAVTSDYRVALPVAYDLDLGNLCNLKCRMCHSQTSSAIAADPVHSRWSPPGIGAARWRGGYADIAPARVLGAEYEGMGWPERQGDISTAWTDSEAVIRVDLTGIELSGLTIRLSAEKPDDHPFKLSVNGKILFDGVLPAGIWEQEYDLSSCSDAAQLEILLSSAAFVRHNGGGSAGVGVEQLRLQRRDIGKNAVSFSRFSKGAEWFREKELLYGEILKNPERVEHLHMIGGEPQLIKEVREVMRHLVDIGAAATINLYMTTNASVVHDEWIALAEKFKSVTIAVSADGCGAIQEYIRFPAQWADLEMNLPRLRGLANAEVYLHTTIQAYNMLNITELAEYCDAIDIELQHHVLESPAYLSALAMPQAIRLEAAGRLRTYADSSTGRNSGSLADVIAAFEVAGLPDAARIEEFMLFTNDLDASRDQEFASTFPELARLLADAGFVWSSQRRFS